MDRDKVEIITISNVNTSTLLCATCRVAFNDNSNYKAHYKTQFHSYNIKRKMV